MNFHLKWSISLLVFSGLAVNNIHQPVREERIRKNIIFFEFFSRMFHLLLWVWQLTVFGRKYWGAPQRYKKCFSHLFTAFFSDLNAPSPSKTFSSISFEVSPMFLLTLRILIILGPISLYTFHCFADIGNNVFANKTHFGCRGHTRRSSLSFKIEDFEPL